LLSDGYPIILIRISVLDLGAKKAFLKVPLQLLEKKEREEEHIWRDRQTYGLRETKSEENGLIRWKR
jgi:hypothetical protein